MSKVIRGFFSKLNGQIFSSFTPSRHKLNVPITVQLQPNRGTGSLVLKKEDFTLKGETRDLSESGISFLVDSIRIREEYLVGQNRVLDAVLELPNGTVKMKVIGQRYEQVDQHDSVAKYLIGAKISEIDAEDRKIYREYILRGKRVSTKVTPNLEVEMEQG